MADPLEEELKSLYRRIEGHVNNHRVKREAEERVIAQGEQVIRESQIRYRQLAKAQVSSAVNEMIAVGVAAYRQAYPQEQRNWRQDIGGFLVNQVNFWTGIDIQPLPNLLPKLRPIGRFLYLCLVSSSNHYPTSQDGSFVPYPLTLRGERWEFGA